MNLFDFRGYCVSCEKCFNEGDIYFNGAKKPYCQQCLCKADEEIYLTPYLIHRNKHYRIIDISNFTAMNNGIYAIEIVKDHLIINDSIDVSLSETEQQEKIEHYLNKGLCVLEKTARGSLFRLPKELHLHTLDFDSDTMPYAEICTLLEAEKKPHGIGYLLEEGTLTAITNAYNVRLYHCFFKGIQPGWMQLDASALNDLKKNPPIPIKVSAALQRITPLDMLVFFKKRLIGQDSEIKKIVYFFYELFRIAATGKDFVAPNWILTAPSGCGKTEVYRILRDFCKEHNIPIPVVQVDLSLITEAGYKGKETTEIIRQIVEANKKTDGTAICFLDEADKKFVPSISSGGNDFNAAVQGNLLTLVEGSMQSAEIDSDTYTIYTSKTMFVFMGAFQDVRNKKQRKQEARATIGFGAAIENESHTDHAADCFYEDITLDEMLETGMIEELAGRVEQVINLHKLSKKDMLHLLEEKARIIGEELGIAIRLTTGAKNDLLEISYGNLGIRRPMNCLRSLVRNTLAESYFDANFDKSRNCITILSCEKAVIKTFPKQMEFEESA